MNISDNRMEKDILNLLLKIFSYFTKNIDFSSFKSAQVGIQKKELKKFFPNINKVINKISLETNIIYQYFLMKINKFHNVIGINFNSFYSALYFRRIINYLQILNQSNINIVDDELVKIFFFLFFLYLEENDKNIPIKKLYLDEAFFKGTFIELNKKYSSQIIYKDSDNIKGIINYWKEKIKIDIINLIDFTFQNIQEKIKNYGNEDDKIIKNIYFDASNILYKLDKLEDNNLSEELKKMIEDFYKKEEYQIFVNYFSETEEDELKKNIDSKFLNEIKPKFINENIRFDDFTSQNNINQNDLNQYLDLKKKKYKRKYLSSLTEVLKWNFDNEINIFSLVDYNITYDIPCEFENIDNYKKKIENLEQENILKIINEIFNDDTFYDYYFSIMRNNIIKKFFTSNLYLEENSKEFNFITNKNENSKSYEVIYNDFLQEYDNKNEGYKKFKNLIILKILPNGDRAYTIRPLKKIVINPAQFYMGKDLKEDDIKTILKSYLLIIILHETEHFFRLLNKTKKVFDLTPRGKEGGRLFIKYLFGVYSINHINVNQSKEVLNYDNWKDHQEIKKIFINQLEDIEENNINDFLLNYFPNSISFYSTKYKSKNNEKYEIKK